MQRAVCSESPDIRDESGAPQGFNHHRCQSYLIAKIKEQCEDIGHGSRTELARFLSLDKRKIHKILGRERDVSATELIGILIYWGIDIKQFIPPEYRKFMK